MIVCANGDCGIFVFYPTHPGEEADLDFMEKFLKKRKGEVCVQDVIFEDEKGAIFTLLLNFGGERKEIKKANITWTHVIGGTSIVIRGREKEDKDALWAPRQTLFFGGELILVSSMEVEGNKVFVFTGGFCEHCGSAKLGGIAGSCGNCRGRNKNPILKDKPLNPAHIAFVFSLINERLNKKCESA